ncbi:Mbov_0397 family ICE element conjugal transfer ATPase [[Mycoplasma] anseris]|uniref:TrsE n=1 Tax=[Mycoplasma] anseris TaxID=92400 RepID=A0A2Z4NCZ0_9BACT|nr:DUF87 domain-containing protein [[Mycoplasma] anseris]AWX69420.1 trsE [[Mycoplasma] anseris]
MYQNRKLNTTRMTIFRDFTVFDFLIMMVILGLAFVLGFAINEKLSIWFKLLISIGIILSTFWILIKSKKHNCRYYLLLFRALKFWIQIRKYGEKTKFDTELLIPYIKLKENQVLEVENGHSNSYVAGFRIKGFNIFTEDEEDRIAYMEQLISIFNQLTFKITLIKTTEAMNLKKNIKYTEDLILSSQRIKENDSVRNYFQHNLYDLTNLDSAKNTNFYYLMFYANDENLLKERQEELFSLFQNAKLKLENISKIEFMKLIAMSFGKDISISDIQHFINTKGENVLNKTKPTKTIKRKVNFAQSIKHFFTYGFAKPKNVEFFIEKDNELIKFLKPKKMEFKKSYCCVDNYFMSFQSFNEFNSLSINHGWTSLLNDTPSTVMINLEPLNDERKQKLLDKTAMIISTNAEGDRSRYRNSRKRLDIQVIEDLIEQINVQKMNVFNMSVLLINKGKSLEELKNVEKINKTVFANASMQINPNIFLQKEAYANTNFITKDFLKNNLEISSRNFIYGWLWTNNELNDSNNFILGFNGSSGSPIIFDIFKKTKDRTSFSMALLGLSGVGKSALTEKFIWNQYMAGNEVIVFDPQREYGDICKKLNGNLIELGRGHDTKINPLQIDIQFTDDLNESFKNTIIINQNIKKIREFFNLLYPDLNERYFRVLDLTLSAFFDSLGYYDPKTKFNELKNKDYKTISDYLKFLDEFKFDNHIEDQLLRPLLEEWKLTLKYDFENHGKYEHLYNGYTTINLDNDLNILDTYNLDVKNQNSSTQGALYLILSFVQNRITNNYFFNKEQNKKIILFVDEAHKFIDPINMASLRFLFDTVKTIRKYNGSLILTTQNLSDFRQNLNVSGLSQALFDNLAYTGIFKLNQKDIDLVDEMYRARGGLTKSEKVFLATAGIGELIFNVDNSTRFIVDTYYNDFEKSQIFKKGDGKLWNADDY